jgi:hypothetical protein
VPVLHIEQIVEQRVAGQTLREVHLCLIEVDIIEIFFVKSSQGPSLSILRELFLKLIDRDGIRYELYETGRT